MLNCLFCKHGKDFQQPERLLSSNTVSICFTCTCEKLIGPYGIEHGEHSMIFWVNDLKICVDGGQEIEHGKCESFVDCRA